MLSRLDQPSRIVNKIAGAVQDRGEAALGWPPRATCEAGMMSGFRSHNPTRREALGAWRRQKDIMGPLVDRTEFRAVLKEVVNCVREHLDAPGITPLSPEQIMFWFQNVTLEDLRIVMEEIDADKADRGQ